MLATLFLPLAVIVLARRLRTPDDLKMALADLAATVAQWLVPVPPGPAWL